MLYLWLLALSSVIVSAMDTPADFAFRRKFEMFVRPFSPDALTNPQATYTKVSSDLVRDVGAGLIRPLSDILGLNLAILVAPQGNATLKTKEISREKITNIMVGNDVETYITGKGYAALGYQQLSGKEYLRIIYAKDVEGFGFNIRTGSKPNTPCLDFRFGFNSDESNLFVAECHSPQDFKLFKNIFNSETLYRSNKSDCLAFVNPKHDFSRDTKSIISFVLEIVQRPEKSIWSIMAEVMTDDQIMANLTGVSLNHSPLTESICFQLLAEPSLYQLRKIESLFRRFIGSCTVLGSHSTKGRYEFYPSYTLCNNGLELGIQTQKPNKKSSVKLTDEQSFLSAMSQNANGSLYKLDRSMVSPQFPFRGVFGPVVKCSPINNIPFFKKTLFEKVVQNTFFSEQFFFRDHLVSLELRQEHGHIVTQALFYNVDNSDVDPAFQLLVKACINAVAMAKGAQLSNPLEIPDLPKSTFIDQKEQVLSAMQNEMQPKKTRKAKRKAKKAPKPAQKPKVTQPELPVHTVKQSEQIEVKPLEEPIAAIAIETEQQQNILESAENVALFSAEEPDLPIFEEEPEPLVPSNIDPSTLTVYEQWLNSEGFEDELALFETSLMTKVETFEDLLAEADRLAQSSTIN